MMGLYWVALQSIWIKEINRFARIWIQTLVPPVITMSLYFIIFGNLIGNRIGEMNGFSYMQFIVPGLIMMSVITNAYANVASSFFSAKFQRNIEELLVAPVPTHIIIAGYVGGRYGTRYLRWCAGDGGIALLCAVTGSCLVDGGGDLAADRDVIFAGGVDQRRVCQNV
ncbi:hypothetical protein OS31_00190 [Dickeya oryzae]